MKAFISRWHTHVCGHESAYRYLQGFLLFLPALYFLNSSFLLLFTLFSLACFRPSIDKTDFFFFCFAAYTLLNTAAGVALGVFEDFHWLKNNGIIGAPIMIMAYLAAKTINQKTLYALLFCISLEALAVIIQAKLGIRVFSLDQLKTYADIPYDLSDSCQVISLATYLATPLQCLTHLSELEPLGFGNGAANLAIRLLSGTMITLLIPMRHSRRLIFLIILIVASAITNGRAAMIATAAMIVIWVLHALLKRTLHQKEWLGTLAACAAGTILFFAAINFCHNEAVVNSPALPQAEAKALPEQSIPTPTIVTTRCNKETEFYPYPRITPTQPNFWLTKKLQDIGRYEMWTSAYNAILASPLWGTHSARRPVYHGVNINGGYLTILYVHGFMGALILALYFGVKIKEHPSRFIMILPFLLSNITDDTIFNYLSLSDILVFYILSVWRAPLFAKAVTYQAPSAHRKDS